MTSKRLYLDKIAFLTTYPLLALINKGHKEKPLCPLLFVICPLLQSSVHRKLAHPEGSKLQTLRFVICPLFFIIFL